MILATSAVMYSIYRLSIALSVVASPSTEHYRAAKLTNHIAILVLTVVLAGAWWVDAMELACLTIIHQVATPIYYILERAHHH